MLGALLRMVFVLFVVFFRYRQCAAKKAEAEQTAFIQEIASTEYLDEKDAPTVTVANLIGVPQKD